MSGLIAVYYDREYTGKRIGANAAAIRVAVNGQLGLELQCVDRPRKFMNLPNAEDMLSSDAQYPFDVFIVNAAADHADDVLETAAIGFAVHDLPYRRIIYLSQGSLASDMADLGIGYVQTNGGNGHLNPNDARTLAELLMAISQEKTE